MKKLIIFDYDGVIVNTFPTVHKIYQKICKKINKDCPKTFEDFKKVYGSNSNECHKNLKLTNEEILTGKIIHKEEMLKEEIFIYNEIKEILKELSKKYNLVVISSALETIVKKNLKKHKLSKYFKEIIAKKDVKAKRLNKSNAMKSAIKKYSTPEDTISIGDRIVDFTESTQAGIKNILLVNYGWGYDPNKIPEHKQNIKINSPKEIIKAIESLI